MNNYRKQKFEAMFQKSCDEGAAALSQVMKAAASSGASKFVVPDNSMAPDFHTGDIVYHRPGYESGVHILQNERGELIIRNVLVTFKGKIIVSTPNGEQQELDYSAVGSGLASIGRCFYAFRQVMPREKIGDNLLLQAA